MERHVAHPALVRVFSGQAPDREVTAAVLHLIICRRCWDQAALVAEELRSDGTLDRTSTLCVAVLRLIEEEEAQARCRWPRGCPHLECGVSQS